MFDRFDDDARGVMVHARREALARNHEYIATEHLLLGILAQAGGIANQVLANTRLDPAQIRTAIDAMVKPGPDSVSAGQPFTPRAKRVLELATEEAWQFGHDHIGTGHLLLGLLGDGEGIAARVLTQLGLTLTLARDEVARLTGASVPEPAAARANEAAPPPVAVVPRPGPLGRWLTHASFWPVYSVAILLLLTWLRPWQKWSELGSGESSIHGIRLHEGVPGDRATPYAVGTVVMACDSKEEPGPQWLPCDGRQLPRDDYAALFAWLGARFGADETLFHLPDYRGLELPRLPDKVHSRVRVSDNMRIAAPATTEAAGAASHVSIRFWIRVR